MSTEISKSHAKVYVEGLKIRNLSASAKGSIEEPGRMVVEVNPRYTSQRCSCCGHTAKENRVSQAVFRCQVCGYEENRSEAELGGANADINAAKNIKTVGQTGMVCQANRISGRQQESAGTREEVLPFIC